MRAKFTVWPDQSYTLVIFADNEQEERLINMMKRESAEPLEMEFNMRGHASNGRVEWLKLTQRLQDPE